MKTNIIKAVQGLGTKVAFSAKKNAPELLIAGGIASGIVSTVLACKATPKALQIAEGRKEELSKINGLYKYKEAKEMNNAMTEEELKDLIPNYDDLNRSLVDEDNYSTMDYVKDLQCEYSHIALDMIKAYGPAIIAGGISIACILASNKIMRGRVAAYASAYVTVSEAFKTYRGRVGDRFGEDVENQLRCGVVQKKYEEIVKDEKGKEKKVKRTIDVSEGPCTDYQCEFTQKTSTMCESTTDYNLMFLNSIEEKANNVLMCRPNGCLFLNEVLDWIGIEHTVAGQIVGWNYNDENSDHYVDFRKQVVTKEIKDKNGIGTGSFEDVIVLDFNVDGDVFNKGLLPENFKALGSSK